ncbi:hypothetical protein Bca52824_011404 [Brassica carinata]|uniref:F-box domain-containing protein n=1 Tax=Brassica carinata TaxID=52824 RepID=A0A8X7WFS7_BRACI|nr:hypothetical protein Bca52824_011404 [Brassica carinata]
MPRSHYPTLSLISKSFRNLTASSKLYKRRSQLGITQHHVYAVLRNRSTGDFGFYLLHKIWLISRLRLRSRMEVVLLPPRGRLDVSVLVYDVLIIPMIKYNWMLLENSDYTCVARSRCFTAIVDVY